MFGMSMDIGIDLGTANVLVFVKGKGVVLREPSVVAMDRDSGRILAIGEEARRMIGRTPGNIAAIRPLRSGVIADYDMTERMIRFFIEKVTGKSFVFRPRIMICIPSGVTTVEQRAVQEAAEQATRPVIAHYRAQRLRPVAGTVADLGCGIASDSAVYAADRGAVVAVELDPLTASFAAKNLEFCLQARVYSGDVTDYVHGELLDAAGKPVGLVWMDPARRELEGAKKARTERIFDPEAFSPPFSFVLSLARLGVPMGVKLGPGTAHEAIPSPEDIAGAANLQPRVEAQWVQHAGSVVELVLWFNAAARESVARAATMVGDAGEVLGEMTSAEPLGAAAPLAAPDDGAGLPVAGGYLYEPSGAVIRAGLVHDFACAVGAHRIDPRIAYLSAEHPLPASYAEFAACYEVLERVPVGQKQLKRWVREHGINAVTIKKRGVDIVPEKLRAALLAGVKKKKGEYKPATLVFTRVGGSGEDAARTEHVGWWVRPLGVAE